jgi:hypothetical protein
MKNLKDILTESKSAKLTYELKHDVYNVLSQLAYEYEMKNKKFDKKDLKHEIFSFLDNFFEDDK